MTLHFTMIFALAALALAGCKDDAAPAAQAPTGPPPETVQYPMSAAHATYSYFDGTGRFQTVRGLNELPASARRYTVVTVGQKTPTVDDKFYVLDEQASTDRVATARLMDREQVQQEGSASFRASDLAFETWDTSLGHLGAAPSGVTAPAAGRVGGGSGGGKRIVIEGITDGRSGRMPKNFKMPKGMPEGMRNQMFGAGAGGSGGQPVQQQAKPSGASGGEWKSVKMYWDVPCRYCTRAERWMRDHDVKFRSIRAREGSPAREAADDAVRRRHGTKDRWPTFVFGDGQIMQGWNESTFRGKARR